METLDTEKLKEVLDMMVASGAVFIKFGELIIEFPREECSKDTSTVAVGFEASKSSVESDNSAAMNKAQQQVNLAKPTGYSALFGEKRPSFARPIAEGKHV
jgi:hypothetical protein